MTNVVPPNLTELRISYSSWCCWQTLESLVCCRWAESCCYAWERHCLSSSTVIQGCRWSSVDPRLALQALGVVVADTPVVTSAGIIAWFLQDIKVKAGDQELGLLYIDMEPFTFHVSLPHIEFGDAFILSGHNELKVISTKKLPDSLQGPFEMITETCIMGFLQGAGIFYLIWMLNYIQLLIWISSQILQFCPWTDLTIWQLI